MDISAPRLENWVSPAPHLLHTQGRGADQRALVRELALRYPEESPDQIAARCAAWGLPVSAILAARMVQAARAAQPADR
jgi:hypothetical protein